MKKLREVQWPRILAEGAAIVVSILLAFWIQAWWDGRQEWEDERIILASLLEEFHEKKRRLEFSRAYNQEIMDSTKKLIEASQALDHGLDTASVDRLISVQWFNNNVRMWSVPVLSSLISSGNLDLVSNSELRLELTVRAGRFESIRISIGREVDFYDNQLMPFLVSNTFMPQTWNALDHLPGFPKIALEREKFLLTETFDHSQLLASRHFQNILMRRWVYLNDILVESFNGVEDQLDATIKLLETELAQ